MSKFKLITLLTLLLAITTSCFNNERYNLEDSVISPTVSNISLSGSWKVIDKIDLEEAQKLPIEDLENLYINNELVEIGNIYTLNPQFESKYLNTKNYFGSDYDNLDYPEIKDKENIEVIIISDDDGFYQEIVKLSENSIYLLFNKSRYQLEKESNNINNEILDKYKNGSIKTNTESFYGKLGVNISIKNQIIDDSGVQKTSYKTYFIYYDNSTTGEMTLEDYTTDNIFLSKKDTFDLIEYTEEWNDDLYQGSLTDYIINGVDDLKFSSKLYSSSIPFELNYISSKYYSFVNNDENNSSNKQYRIKEINDKDDDGFLNIEDISGEEGYKIIKSLINKEKDSNGLDLKLNSPLENYINIGISRNKGYWEYKTSLVLGEEPKLKYKEYTINIIPNIDLAKNKVENLKWSDILKINPDAIDVVYSPEKNFYVIMDKNNLYFYNSFRKEPLKIIEMDDSEKSIIKYNWIIGTNVDIWKENFLLVHHTDEES